MVGDVDVRWRIFPLHLDDIEAGPISLKVVGNETSSPVVRAVTGWADLGNGRMVVNISWDHLPEASELRIYILYGDPAGTIPEDLHTVLPGNAVSGSFEVLRQNVTFLISAIFDLFPAEADRTLRVESSDPRKETDGGSMISFNPPLPVDDRVNDENGEKLSLLWLVIPAIIGAFLVLLVILLFAAGGRRRKIVWDME
jgi:hypothetical protein